MHTKRWLFVDNGWKDWLMLLQNTVPSDVLYDHSWTDLSRFDVCIEYYLFTVWLKYVEVLLSFVGTATIRRANGEIWCPLGFFTNRGRYKEQKEWVSEAFARLYKNNSGSQSSIDYEKGRSLLADIVDIQGESEVIKQERFIPVHSSRCAWSVFVRRKLRDWSIRWRHTGHTRTNQEAPISWPHDLWAHLERIPPLPVIRWFPPSLSRFRSSTYVWFE